MANKKDKPTEINIEPVDVAIGSTVIAAGITFLALVFMRGSDSEVVKGVKKESFGWIKKLL